MKVTFHPPLNLYLVHEEVELEASNQKADLREAKHLSLFESNSIRSRITP